MFSFWNKDNKALALQKSKYLQSQSERCFRNSQWDPELYQFIRTKNNDALLNQYLSFQDQLVELTEDTTWTIEQEIAALLAYFQLWSFDNESLSIQMDSNKALLSTNIQPLLLFPLLKNAIVLGYHGMDLYPIKMHIKSTVSFLQVDISNRVNHYIENQAQNHAMDQFKDRLTHHYSDQYSLLFNSNSNIFKAHLTIRFNVNP